MILIQYRHFDDQIIFDGKSYPALSDDSFPVGQWVIKKPIIRYEDSCAPFYIPTDAKNIKTGRTGFGIRYCASIYLTGDIIITNRQDLINMVSVINDEISNGGRVVLRVYGSIESEG